MTTNPHFDNAPVSPLLVAALRDATVYDLVWALGEILEPSHKGPIDTGYAVIEDEYEAYADALHPITEAYRAAYDKLVRACCPVEEV